MDNIEAIAAFAGLAQTTRTRDRYSLACRRIARDTSLRQWRRISVARSCQRMSGVWDQASIQTTCDSAFRRACRTAHRHDDGSCARAVRHDVQQCQDQRRLQRRGPRDLYVARIGEMDSDRDRWQISPADPFRTSASSIGDLARATRRC